MALALGRKGKHVVIVEKDLYSVAQGRPEVLANATIEVFNQLGIGERIKQEACITLEELQLRDSKSQKLILEFGKPDFLRSGFQPYSTDPNLTRKLLLEAAQKCHTVTLKRGVQINDLIHESGRVAGVRGSMTTGEQVEFRGKIIIGDDGSLSKMRSSMGIQLKLREFPLIFLAASGALLPNQSENAGQAWIDPKKINDGLFGGIFMPQPKRQTAFVFLMSQETYQWFLNSPSTKFFEAARNLSPLCEGMEKNYSFPDSFHLFKRPFAHSPKYVSEGLALIGDAAHPVTPAGGQGANGSVADAISLARHIEADLSQDRVLMRSLEAYEAERRPANQRSLNISVRADFVFRVLGIFPILTPILVGFLKQVNQNISLKDRFIQTVSRSFQSCP